MGWRAVTVITPLVVIKGATGGEFVYDGSGNLRAANVGATTTDPLQGITCRQGISTFNGHGAVISLQATALDAYLLYADTGTSAQGALIASEASAKTTDPFGNTVYAGVVSYATGVVNAITQLLNGFLQTGTPGQIAGTGGAAPGLVGLASGGNPGVVRIDSGLTATGDADAFVDVRSKNAQASINGTAQRNIQLAGPLAMSNEGSTPAQLVDSLLYDDANSFPQILPGTATGDTTVYKIGHRDFWSTTDQSITSTTFATVCGSAAVGNGAAYRVRAVLQVLQGATSANNNFRLGFTGTISQVRMKASFVGAGGVANSTFVQTTTSNNGLLQAPAFAANAQYVAEFEGLIITTSTGTLSIQAAEQTAGDPFTVQALSLFELSPAN